MENSHKPDTDLADTQDVTPEPDQSRRHFAKAIAGSGVILSLASKPVMGANYWCTGSGGMSGNTSSHGAKLSCFACSPGYWKGHPDVWPAPYYPYNFGKCHKGKRVIDPSKTPTTFRQVFGSGPTGTMMSILKPESGYSGSLEFHAIGALLNAAKAAKIGSVSAYTVQEVISIYNSSNKAKAQQTLSSTYEGDMHNCPSLSGGNGSIYLDGGFPFYRIISSNGDETATINTGYICV